MCDFIYCRRWAQQASGTKLLPERCQDALAVHGVRANTRQISKEMVNVKHQQANAADQENPTEGLELGGKKACILASRDAAVCSCFCVHVSMFSLLQVSMAKRVIHELMPKFTEKARWAVHGVAVLTLTEARPTALCCHDAFMCCRSSIWWRTDHSSLSPLSYVQRQTPTAADTLRARTTTTNVLCPTCPTCFNRRATGYCPLPHLLVRKS